MSKDIRGLQRFQSFKYGLVDDEDLGLEMLGLEMLSARKLTSHAYKEERKSVKNLTAKINLIHYFKPTKKALIKKDCKKCLNVLFVRLSKRTKVPLKSMFLPLTIKNTGYITAGPVIFVMGWEPLKIVSEFYKQKGEKGYALMHLGIRKILGENHKMFFRHITVKSGRVLDVGCGDGVFLVHA